MTDDPNIELTNLDNPLIPPYDPQGDFDVSPVADGQELDEDLSWLPDEVRTGDPDAGDIE